MPEVFLVIIIIRITASRKRAEVGKWVKPLRGTMLLRLVFLQSIMDTRLFHSRLQKQFSIVLLVGVEFMVDTLVQKVVLFCGMISAVYYDL